MIGHWYTNEIVVSQRHDGYLADAELAAAVREAQPQGPSIAARLLGWARHRSAAKPAAAPAAVPSRGTAPAAIPTP